MPDFDPLVYFDRRLVRTMDRLAILVAVLLMAVATILVGS